MQKSADKAAITRARNLRENATNAERRLWSELRLLRRSGFHFRRQAPFQRYILDFVEHSARLVIELDGPLHARPENELRDSTRDDALARENYYTLRIWNREIDADMNGVMETILRVLDARRRAVAGVRPHIELPQRWR